MPSTDSAFIAPEIESALIASMAARGRQSKQDGKSKARHRTETSELLEKLFSGGPLPGLPDPADVAMSSFSVGYRPGERLLVSEWADKHRILTGVGASEPGPWKTSRTPYLKELMDNLSTGSPIWKQSFIAGAQIGKTETGLNWIAYIMAAAPGPMMFVVPKTDTAEKISEQRLGPMINATAAVKEKVTKRLLLSVAYHGGLLFFASARSSTDLMSMPAQYIYCDEVDRFPFDCEGEGPPVNLAVARTRTFKNKRKIFLTSTPTKESTSIIWAAWLEGDMRLYHVPCPHCAKPIVFEFENLKWDWGKAKETVHYVCPECKEKIYESQKRTMLPTGKWIPTRKDLENVPEGVRSYRLPSLYAPIGWYSWDEIATKWEGCQGIPSKIAEFRNVDLGLPSVEISERVDWETVYSRGSVGVEPYDLGTIVPKGVLYLTAGADVGKDHIEIGIWGWGRDRKRWLIDHIRIEGNTQLPQVWAAAADAVHRTYPNADGVEFGIAKFFVDTGAWPEIVKPWIRTQNQQVVMGCDGIDHLDQPVKIVTQAEPVRGMPGKKTNVGALKIAQVGVSYLKSELMGVLSIPRPEDTDEAPISWLHVPKQGFTKELAKQLVAERKVIERDQNGRITGTRWERIESRRAEVLDCHNYARAAAALVGWDRFRDRDFERWEERIAAAAAELKSHAEAEARGAPVTVAPKSQVGVSPRKPTAVRPAQPASATAGKALPRTPPQPSTFGVTTASTSRRIVPAPRALREEDA